MDEYCDIEIIIRNEFDFLTAQLGFQIDIYSDSSLRDSEFLVLRYSHLENKRVVEIRFQQLNNGRPNLFAVVKRINNGVEPNHKDNINYMPFGRIKAYFKNDNWEHFGFDFKKSEVLERIKEFGLLLKTHNDFLKLDQWFDRNRLIQNEKSIYVFDRDWKRSTWKDDVVNAFEKAFPNGFKIEYDSDDVGRYEILGDTIELTDNLGSLAFRFNYGWESRDVSVLSIQIKRGAEDELREVRNPNINQVISKLIKEIDHS